MKYYYFAQAYGENNYGACNYEQNATGCTTTGSSGASSGAGKVLTNTGLMLAIIVTAACLLALAAIIVRVWRRQKPAQTPVPQEADDQVDQARNDSQDN